MRLKWLRGILCLPLVLLYYARFRISGMDSEFWDYVYDSIKSNGSMCLSKWLLIGALSDKNPNRLIRLYPVLLKLKPDITLSSRSAIAIFESAVWLKSQRLAKSMIDSRKSLAPSLSDQSAKRLEYLYLWRFHWNTKEAVGLNGLISPRMPHEAFLPYVDYLARATVADSLEKPNDALLYYREALRTIPQDSSEYRYAMERCNCILNQ